MINGQDKWYTVLRTLRDQIISDLTTPVDRYGIVPAAITWDACDCGALYLAAGQIYISETFPEQFVASRAGSVCTAPYEVCEMIVQVMRCAPVAQSNSTMAPTTEALEASALTVRRDAYDVLKSVSWKLCAMKDAFDIEDYIIDLQGPAGPTGACVGTELRVRVGLLRN